MKNLFMLGGKLLKNSAKGAPMLDSIRQIIVAIREGKFDPKKLLWVLVEGVSILGFVWLTLYIAKSFGITVDDILGLIEKIMKLGLGS